VGVQFFDPQVIIILQSILPYLVWEILNLFGEQIIYVVLLTIAFWCVNKEEGNIAIMLVMFSLFINILLKYAFGMPRPPSELRQNPEYAADQSYGFPSGAVQTSTTFWGWIMVRLKRWWVVIIGGIFITITALARMGLGLHYLGDVIGGIIVGVVLIVWAYFLVPYFLSRWKQAPPFFQNWFFPLIALLFFFVYLVAYAVGLPYFPTENVAVSMGVVFGFSIGIVLEKRYVGFSTTVSKNTKVLRAIIGIVIALVMYYALDAVFSFIPALSLLAFSTRFIRYILLGFFGAFIVPYIFNFLEKRRGLTAPTSA
jgi:membrane-associated phospholipid phosphatase